MADSSIPVDPTANVIALNEASSRRLDDLRAAQEALTAARLEHLAHVGEIRADHAREIREIETARGIAVRQVDITNAESAAIRSQAAIAALERTTQASAETLRAMVDNTAKALAAQNASSTATVEARLAALERSSYEGMGRQQLAHPVVDRLVAEMQSLQESRASGAGAKGGIIAGREWIMALLGLAGALIGIVTYLSR